jgi:hypothetical protein
MALKITRSQTHMPFFWEFIKGDAHIAPLLLTIEEFKTRTIAASAKMTKIFSKKCDRNLNIGLMLLMSLVALTLNSTGFS